MTPYPPAASPSPGVLLQMIEQNDEKHEEAHKRLRADLTEGFNTMTSQLDRLDQAQREDHDILVAQTALHERRKELSATHAVLLAALVSGLFRLLEVVITLIGK